MPRCGPRDRDAKVIVFKYKRKVRYRRKKGHRQHYTRLAITAIVLDGEEIGVVEWPGDSATVQEELPGERVSGELEEGRLEEEVAGEAESESVDEPGNEPLDEPEDVIIEGPRDEVVDEGPDGPVDEEPGVEVKDNGPIRRRAAAPATDVIVSPSG